MLTNVAQYLYVGDQHAYEHEVKGYDGWAVVHACKEPYHRDALGYRSRGAPKDHPEYFYAYRDEGRRLILNFVDAPDPTYVPRQLFDVALDFIDQWRNLRTNVLVHCNHGQSRSPALAIAYLARHGELPANTFADAVDAFQRLHPPTVLGAGVHGFLAGNWDELMR